MRIFVFASSCKSDVKCCFELRYFVVCINQTATLTPLPKLYAPSFPWSILTADYPQQQQFTTTASSKAKHCDNFVRPSVPVLYLREIRNIMATVKVFSLMRSGKCGEHPLGGLPHIDYCPGCQSISLQLRLIIGVFVRLCPNLCHQNTHNYDAALTVLCFCFDWPEYTLTMP